MFSTFIKVSNYKNMTAQSLYWFQFNLTKWLTHEVDGEGDIIRVHWAALNLNKTFLGELMLTDAAPAPWPPPCRRCSQSASPTHPPPCTSGWRSLQSTRDKVGNHTKMSDMKDDCIQPKWRKQTDIFEKNLFNLYLYKKDKE